MFRFLGNLVCRAWPALLVGWAALLAITWLAAPPWESVSLDEEFGFLPKNVWPVGTAVEKLVREFREQGKLPQGMDATVTGGAIIGRDHSVAQVQSIRATGTLTVILVVALLVLIYRAPLLALIPLATVGL